MRKRYSFKDISLICNRQIFFDANVLLYIFWPTGQYTWERRYSSIFGQLIKQNNKLTTDFIVISETLNRVIRIEHQKYLNEHNLKNDNCKFKGYRDSKDGKEALNDIYNIIRAKVLRNFSIMGKNFQKSDIETFLSVDSLDFSDKAILSLCKENNCVLLTNDKDFTESDIEILTSNPALLRNNV